VKTDTRLVVVLVHKMYLQPRTAIRQYQVVLVDPNVEPAKVKRVLGDDSGMPVGVYRMMAAAREAFLAADRWAKTEVEAVKLARRLASRVGAERVGA